MLVALHKLEPIYVPRIVPDGKNTMVLILKASKKIPRKPLAIRFFVCHVIIMNQYVH